MLNLKMPHITSCQIINIYIISIKTDVQSYCETSHEVVWIRCGFWKKKKKICLKYNKLKLMPYHFIHLISLAFTQIIPHSKLKARLKELAQCCFIKQNDQNRYACLVWERWNLFYEKNNSLKLIFRKCSSFNFFSYLLCLVRVFFNKQ